MKQYSSVINYYIVGQTSTWNMHRIFPFLQCTIADKVAASVRVEKRIIGQGVKRLKENLLHGAQVDRLSYNPVKIDA